MTFINNSLTCSRTKQTSFLMTLNQHNILSTVLSYLKRTGLYNNNKFNTIKLLVFLLLLQANLLSAQSWTAEIVNSDFDGLVKKMSAVGYGGESPYTSPILTIMKNSSKVTFQISGAGYTGCDYNNVYFVFDGVRKYKTMSILPTEDKNGLIMREFASIPRTHHFNYYPIFNEMMTSQRMSIRVENSCFKRDYSFSLENFSNSLKLVLSKDELSTNTTIHNSNSNLYNRFIQTQEKYSYLSTYWRNNISKCEFQFSQDALKKEYKISNKTLKDILTIFYVYDNDILKAADDLWPDKVKYIIENGELVKLTSTGGFHPTGFKVLYIDDSLKLNCTSLQQTKLDILNSYSGNYKEEIASFLLLLTNNDFAEFTHNFTPELLSEIGRRISSMKNTGNYTSFSISKTSRNKAIVEYKVGLGIFSNPVPELMPFKYTNN